MKIEVNIDAIERLEEECKKLNITLSQRINDILNTALPPKENLIEGHIEVGIEKIKDLLLKIPCIKDVYVSEKKKPFWWLKFSIDIDSNIAWNVVQEFSHILNYISVDEKLPTRFYPVSAPPYMNGGPKDFLYWIIEPTIPFVDSNIIYDFLIGRLPEDLEKEENWILD
jgi:hypothetical protein